jgi:hypothetical protein
MPYHATGTADVMPVTDPQQRTMRGRKDNGGAGVFLVVAPVLKRWHLDVVRILRHVDQRLMPTRDANWRMLRSVIGSPGGALEPWCKALEKGRPASEL